MQDTLGQITYAVMMSSLGASEFALGAVVAAGFLVSGVSTLVTRTRDSLISDHGHAWRAH